MMRTDGGGQRAERGFRFEALVAKVFEAQNFKVQRSVPIDLDDRTIELDMLLTSPPGRTSVVEVKLYRTRYPNPADIERACLRLSAARGTMRADHAVLVCNLPASQMPAPLPHDVTLVGFDYLLGWAKRDLPLLAELTDFDRELNSALKDFDRPIERSGLDAKAPDASQDDAQDLALTLSVKAPEARVTVTAPRRGHDLATELKEVPAGGGKKVTLSSGRTGVPWSLFEKICLEALEYIFEGALDNWVTQKAVSGESKRLDGLAKITGEDVFCRTVIEDFSSRYILFEFKNYTKSVTQNWIYITEKYLYPRALRATAVIISPKGLDLAAKAATQGALRDAGKLMLEVTVAQLCEMLEAKDNGTPATTEMEKLLDQYLLAIGR